MSCESGGEHDWISQRPNVRLEERGLREVPLYS
jgi:hypothetical protein